MGWGFVVKLWNRADEWVQYASCGEDDRFTSETSCDDEELEKICAGCRVRPECIKWAVDSSACAVYVAGVRLPDPSHKKALAVLHTGFRDVLPGEFERRGEDV